MHPPAAGGHIRKELHDRQQVVVVIRHQAQGAAQLLELWGQHHGGQGRGHFRLTLTSPLRGSEGQPWRQGQEGWSLACP